MKLPLLFYFMVYWFVAVVINVIFKTLFGFINFKGYGFLMLLIFSFDYIAIFILRKRYNFSFLFIIMLLLSLVSVILFKIFIWKNNLPESLLGHFLLLLINLNLLYFLIRFLWNKFKFDYANHFLILILYALFSTVVYFIIFYLFSSKADYKPIFKTAFLKQLAFIVPYPFIYKIGEILMKFLKDNFTTPTKRIIVK